MSAGKCGTYGAAQSHRRRGEPLDEACRQANARYMRMYRAANPDAYRRERDIHNARTRALWRLARQYPKAFRRLVADELSKGEAE